MTSRQVIVLAIVGIMTLGAGFFTTAEPKMTITSPSDGSVSTNKMVSVTGTSSGSDAWINHTSPADFNGVMSQTVMTDKNGSGVALPNPYEDFSGASINASKWTMGAVFGMSVAQSGGFLQISGTSTGAPWAAKGSLTSVQTKIPQFSVDADVVTASGTGHSVYVELYQDDSNFIEFGYLYDSTNGVNSEQFAWAEIQAGVVSTGLLGDATPGWHNLELAYNNNQDTVGIYVDSDLLTSQALTLSNWNIVVFASPRATGDSVSAMFDNIVTQPEFIGNYTSTAIDTRMDNPDIISINWTAVTPAGTSALVFIRSSVTSGMLNPTAWAGLTNGQTDFSMLTLDRYIQYRVELHSDDILVTPVFNAIYIGLHKNIVLVELSTDNQDTWTPATGTDQWHANLALSEDENVIWVRATDAAGDTNISSITVTVDTTPPTGTVTIAGGATITNTPEINLTLNATDKYGIDFMMVSESQNFTGANWLNYAPTLQWILSAGDGMKTIYAMFSDGNDLNSAVAQTQILLDTTPPVASISANGGATYTRSVNVSVQLTAVEAVGVASMQLVEGSTFPASAPWVPFQPNTTFALSQSDGTKTISVRLKDTAGNIGAANSTTIILDSTPPTTTLGTLPQSSPLAAFTVSWNSTDAVSGVQYYDVQYKKGTGAWTDWFTHTNLTSATYTGNDLETYSFHARAQDKAGNLEAFPSTVNNAVTINLPEPVVTYLKPKDKATVSGSFMVTGSCQLVSGGRNVTRVEWRMDNDTWQTADGLLSWSFKVDSTKYSDGKHSLQVRTYDGTHYSTDIALQVTVKNAKAKGFLGADGMLVFLSAAGIGLSVMVWRRNRGSPR